MSLDYATLDILRQSHPAWRLLRSDHAALLASFLHRVFIEPNLRAVSQADLAEALEDELFALRDRLGAAIFPKSAIEYLNDWAAPERGWLRKFYRHGSDEPYFDLTSSTEKAIAWLGTLAERSFVGTESRLLTLFELLKQMSQGSETDPQMRITELHRRRDEIDAEMARIMGGDIPLLDDTALRELCELQPLQHGLAELVTYLQLGSGQFKSVVDEDTTDVIVWTALGAEGQEQTKHHLTRKTSHFHHFQHKPFLLQRRMLSGGRYSGM